MKIFIAIIKFLMSLILLPLLIIIFPFGMLSGLFFDLHPSMLIYTWPGWEAIKWISFGTMLYGDQNE